MAQQHLAETRAILEDLIAFPTVSDSSNLDLIVYLANLLESAGARVSLFPDETGAKANLFATLGPERDGGIVLSGHSDVVPVVEQNWASDPFVLHEADGRLYGRGACDMKGFLAATVAMAPVLGEAIEERPLHFAFTYDEEVGCFGARALMASLEQHGLRPSMAIVGEPTNMRIIEGHKGCFEYSTRFHGLAGHGSAPDRGVNAVEYAARYLGRLMELKDELRLRAPAGSQFDPPWATINVGALHGGVAHNVIAAEAQVDWEMRPVEAADADYVKRSLQRYTEDVLLPAMQAVDPEARIDLDIIGEVAGLAPTHESEARDVLMELTGANDTDLVAFGTEAGLFQEAGMSVVVCGPGSIEQAHKPDEYVEITQLEQCLTMLGRLAGKLVA